MHTIDVDARRYGWCWSQAIYRLGLMAPIAIEDIQGAVDAGQEGLLDKMSRSLAEICVTTLYLVQAHPRPLPQVSLRPMVALDGLDDDELRDQCWQLLRGRDPGTPPQETKERCDALLARTKDAVGKLPELLTPEGYFPALSMAGDWLKFLERVGESDFLPAHWKKS